MILTTNHTSFTVSDVERSVAFYRDLLGFKLLSLAERPPGSRRSPRAFPAPT